MIAKKAKEKKMNKAELVEAIAKEGKCTKSEAENGLKVLNKVVFNTLKKGGEISIVGFGRLSVKKRKARKGINPQTKKQITIPASKAIVFKASKHLKESL